MNQKIAPYQNCNICRICLALPEGKLKYKTLHPNCPRHGSEYANWKYKKCKKSLNQNLEFRSLIFFLNDYPHDWELKNLITLFKSRINALFRNTKAFFVFHPLKGKWHLHIGIQNIKFKKNNCAEIDSIKTAKKRGTKPKVNSMDELIKIICAEIDSIKTCGRLEIGEFKNDPFSWLGYCLRQNIGFGENEKFHKGFKPDYGFYARRIKKDEP